MNRRTFAFLSASTVAALVVPFPSFAAEPAKPDEEKILGTWKATRFYVGGKLQTLPDEASVVLTFTADSFKAVVMLDGGVQEIEGTYFIDAKPTPRTLDANVRDDGRDVAAIYRLEDSSLTVCLRNDGGPRPADIDNPCDLTMKLVFKREGK